MNTKELTSQLVAIHAALVEKINAQPFLPPSLTLRQSGEWSIALHRDYCHGDYELRIVKSDNPEACIQAALDFIAAMPDPEQAAKQNWQRSLCKVIDEGHALNLPDEVMQPLRQGSQAMTENLLTVAK